MAGGSRVGSDSEGIQDGSCLLPPVREGIESICWELPGVGLVTVSIPQEVYGEDTRVALGRQGAGVLPPMVSIATLDKW